MGCGTSKSTQVADTNITIKEDPSKHSNGRPPITNTRHDVEYDLSGQSELERDFQSDLHIQDQPSMESTKQDREHGQATVSPTSTGSYPKPVVFEVCMSHDGITSPKQQPPRRLAKMESVPKLTPEMLAEKQRQVEKRKKKELEKRANPRMSKKDRLRKEIVEARDMEVAQQQYTQIEKKRSANSLNRAKAQAEIVEKQKKREKHSQKVRGKVQQLQVSMGEDNESGTCSYDASVEMDVDSTYNTDQQIGFWESQSSQNSSDNNEKPVTTRQNDSDDLFFRNNTEQYM